jgi:ABC-type dipeptide/oligopeptide/nickel transport system permease subunit
VSQAAVHSADVEPVAEPLERARLWRRLTATSSGRVGLAVVGALVIVAIFAPLIAPRDPLEQDLANILKGPSGRHLLGTDELGRDMLSRIFYGSRISLGIATSSVLVAALLGMLFGTAAASLGRWADSSIMRLTDALLAFPVLILAITISIGVGRGALASIVAIAAVNTPVFTRLARAQTLRINQRQYMTAATLFGASTVRRVARHVVPNLINAFIVQASVALSFAIIIEAGLSFLGLGIQAPTPDWGVMVATGKTYMTIAPHMMLAPAGAIFITVLALNLLGDAVSDALDPRTSGE